MNEQETESSTIDGTNGTDGTDGTDVINGIDVTDGNNAINPSESNQGNEQVGSMMKRLHQMISKLRASGLSAQKEVSTIPEPPEKQSFLEPSLKMMEAMNTLFSSSIEELKAKLQAAVEIAKSPETKSKFQHHSEKMLVDSLNKLGEIF